MKSDDQSLVVSSYSSLARVTPQLKPKSSKNLKKFVEQAAEIEAIQAKIASAIGYSTPLFIQATLPHKEPRNQNGEKINYYTRQSGYFKLTIEGHHEYGCPYGVVPRLIFMYICTEVKRTKEKKINLGTSLRGFMGNLGINCTGGPRGSARGFKIQLARLVGCRITCDIYSTTDKSSQGIETLKAIKSIAPIEEAVFTWALDKKGDKTTPAFVEISDKLYDAILATPVPYDKRAIIALKGSSMSLDIYLWLTYRMYSLEHNVLITWQQLQDQFGADFKRTIDFKVNFKKHLAPVLEIYKQVKIQLKKEGICLLPSPTHIPQTPKVGS